MGQIYNNAQGIQVYDNNGFTFNAKTGENLGPAPTTPQQVPQAPNSPGTPTVPTTQPTPATTASTPPTGLFGYNAPATGNTQFTSFLTAAIDRMGVTNQLAKQKSLLVTALYDRQLTPDELKLLPPEIQGQVAQFDPTQPNQMLRPELEMQLRLINDSISGRTATLNQSVQFLAGEYNKSLDRIQTQREDALKLVEGAMTTYGSRAFSNLSADQKRNVELQAGLPSGYLDNLPTTVAQERYSAQYGYDLSSSGSGAYDLSSYASDPSYSSSVASIVNQIGPVFDSSAAQKYITSVVPNSPITGAMIMNYAQKYDVDPQVLMAQLQKESNFGTSNVATLNNNPGGVSYVPGLTPGTARPPSEGGSYAKFSTMDEGVDYMAKWLSSHRNGGWVTNIASRIEDFSQQPVMTGMYGGARAVRGQLGKDGFNLSRATLLWNQANKWINTFDSATFQRAIVASRALERPGGLLDILKGINKEWDQQNPYTPLDWAAYQAALNGAMGQESQNIAQKLETQIQETTADLGSVFRYGLATTDSSLESATKTLSTNWDYGRLDASINLIDQNVKSRIQSLKDPVNASMGFNPYIVKLLAPDIAQQYAAEFGQDTSGAGTSGQTASTQVDLSQFIK